MKNIEKVLGVDVFEWTDWDIVDESCFQFYGVGLLLPELEKYNDTVETVSLTRGGELEIYDTEGEVILTVNIGSLESFRSKLESLYEE